MITFKHNGNFKNTERFFKKTRRDYFKTLEIYGRQGVEALSSATPIESGLTADSWTYEIIMLRDTIKIVWSNTNVIDNVPIAIIIQYGHGTRNGGYVQGQDYVNPAIKPIFDKIIKDVWAEVTK